MLHLIRERNCAKGYKIGTLVAFSGEVNDADAGPDPFTERSKPLNPALNGRDIRKAFEGDERVVAVELKPEGAAQQGDLVAVIAPVHDRLMRRYKAAQEMLIVANAQKNDAAAKLAKDELDAHNAMSMKALNSLTVQAGLRDLLLNHGHLYEALRAEGAPAA